MDNNVTQKVSDLKRMADERKHHSVTRKPSSPTRGLSYGTTERPASRAEIGALEQELEEKVRLVLDNNYKRSSDEFGASFVYEPHRENMLITREKMLKEFNSSSADLGHEPWLETYVQCECLKVLCDEISMKFSDMLGVSSSELGSISRKLRLTYSQCFQQMMLSWKALRESYLAGKEESSKDRQMIESLQYSLTHKEAEISHRFDNEIARITREFNTEKDRDHEKVVAAELKVDQMSDTLKYLNGIFRTMQIDGPALKTADLQAANARLEKENKELRQQNAEFENMKSTLITALQKIKSLESTIKGNESEISRLTLQLSRREEVINTLSEREALRNAEMDKLAQIAKLKDDEMLSMDMQDPATSVLCIKCKKSLDDMSNIRSALMGDTAPRERFTCESYRLLLPNLRGKKPHRSNLWIRACVRSILLCKMKEDSALLAVRGDISRFPGYVYSWFTRSTEGLVGANLMKALVQCDEDRWGLFYGLKALAKEDSECAVFWSLLDEAFGQDGLQYLLYCLSVAITIAPALWGQLGASMITNSSVDVKAEDDKKVKPAIWMELTLAKQATHMILVKALAPQVVNALEAIDAVRSRPKDLSDSKEATHINLFTWLRLMLQQLQADQIHRNAAIRLMFETASVGAMTPGPTGSGAVTSGIHVEYPQFQSICQTLFPFLSVNSIADFYTVCVVNKRVTADIFTTEADLKGYFSYALRLAPLPLMRNIQDMMSGATEPDGQVGEIVPPAYAKQTSIIIRSKLAALIHRKLVAITPAVRFMCRSLPERWRVLLTDATAAVHTALTDTYNKLKEIYMEQLTLGSLFVAKEETVCFLDGILPYVAYRRLVSLAVYVKSVTENPLLPCEIFTTSMGGNYLQALFHAEKLINHLESSLLLPLQVSSSASHTAGGAIVTKHAKFESVRKALIARKIQLTIRKFLSKDVPVPRSVRFLMTAGYLSSNRTQGINQPLKTREVYHEPWWAQGHVAAIYLFKINHDARAVRLGLPCLPLCHAVAAYHYFLWGSIDIAERAIHDLFISIRAYRMNLPRLRLFAAFLGDGKDLDDAITKMLTSPQAIAVYFHLLFDLHKEQRKYEDRMRAAADGDLPLVRQHTVAAVNGRKEMTSDILEIECLYPSNEDSFQRSERKESFMVDLSVCQAVAQRFASSQPWLKGKTSIYTDLPERLRSDSQGRLDVDDFLYIVLMQWAKLAHYHILRCTNRTAVFEQTLTADNGHVLNIDTSALIVNATVDSSTLLKSAIKGNAPEPPARQGAITRRISMMPLSNIKSIVESIYRPGEAADLADPLHYACSYIHCIRSRRNNIQKYDIAPEDDEEVRGELSVGVANGQMPTAKFWDARCGAEMSVLLKDCVMWDTNLGIFQPETTAAAAAGNAGAKLSRSNTPKTKNPMVSADDGHLTVFIHTQPVKIYNAVFPEIALATAKSAFASYQSPFNSLLNRIAEDPKFSNNLEVRARIQSLRIHLLSLTDFFQTIDLHYVSPKLHTLSLLYVDDKDSEELSVYRIEKAKSTLLAADAQVKVQSLMSSIAELVTMTQQDFPRDHWSAGSKLPLERAFVYSIHTKSALI